MFRFSLLTTLLLAAPALAYTITSPGLDANWTSTGPNTLTWQRVSTDASTFAVILVNDVCQRVPHPSTSSNSLTRLLFLPSNVF